MRLYTIVLPSFLLVFCSLLSSSISAQYQVTNLFRKYRNDEGVQHINLSGDIAKMLQAKDQKLRSTVDEMHVYIFSDKSGISPADKEKVKKGRQTDGYEMLFQTKDKTSRLEIYGIEKQNRITHIYVEIIQNESSIYLLMTGNILFDELSKMNFNFDGSEVMKKIPVP